MKFWYMSPLPPLLFLKVSFHLKKKTTLIVQFVHDMKLTNIQFFFFSSNKTLRSIWPGPYIHLAIRVSFCFLMNFVFSPNYINRNGFSFATIATGDRTGLVMFLWVSLELIKRNLQNISDKSIDLRMIQPKNKSRIRSFMMWWCFIGNECND
jgi:hypothetical protein